MERCGVHDDRFEWHVQQVGVRVTRTTRDRPCPPIHTSPHLPVSHPIHTSSTPVRRLETDLAGLRPRLMALESAAKAREGEAARLSVLLEQVRTYM